jgi:hypothetical protein
MSAVRMPASTVATFLAIVLFACVTGCAGMGPSNHRDWVSDQTLMPTAEFNGDVVTIHNVRNCSYSSAEDYELRYHDKTIDLGDVQSVDFIMIPFADMPQVAHVMMSFGTRADDYTCVSIEIRREKGEKYSPLSGFMNEYELMYIVGDERDLVQLRAIHRLDDVYVYRTRATPDQARLLLVDMLERANKLAREPEYYHTVTNNCTTNVVDHINKFWPHRIAYNVQVLLPGYTDRLVYELGLLDTSKSFAETKAAARVNRLAYIHRDSPEFSARIREPVLALRGDGDKRLR